MSNNLLCPVCGAKLKHTLLVCDLCDWIGEELDAIPEDKDFQKLLKKQSKKRAEIQKVFGHKIKKGD